MTLLDELRAFARARMIPDLDAAWRFLSTRIAAAGVALYTLLLTDPDGARAIWEQVPAEVRALLPAHLVQWITALLFLAVILGRLTRQAGRETGPGAR